MSKCWVYKKEQLNNHSISSVGLVFLHHTSSIACLQFIMQRKGNKKKKTKMKKKKSHSQYFFKEFSIQLFSRTVQPYLLAD